jgi:4-hydroxybenzoate polyprenyltransferase
MSGLIVWQLIGSFTNVFLLTRATQYFLKRTRLGDRKRAYVVFILIGLLDLIGLILFFGGLRMGLHTWLFYYAPFLVMWLIKDLMEASRKEKEEAQTVDNG